MQSLYMALLSYDNGFFLGLLILVALILGLYLWRSARNPKESRAERLQRQYGVLSLDTLSNIPDDELVDAVIANLIAKLDPQMPDDYSTMPLQTHGRSAVYSVWLTCRELQSIGLSEYLNGPSGRFAEMAANGLDLVGATDCAEELRAACELDAEDDERVQVAQQKLAEAITREKPLTLCCDYIHENSDEFTDDESVEITE